MPRHFEDQNKLPPLVTVRNPAAHEPEELVGVPEPDSPKIYTRREAIIGGIGLLAGAAIGYAAATSSTGEKHRYNAAELDRVIMQGLTETWNDVIIFDGLLMMNSSVQFFTKPTLDKGSSIKLPLSETDKLGVLRPFAVDSSLAIHASDLGTDMLTVEAAQPIPAGTLGFWYNQANIFVYANYNQQITNMQPIERDLTYFVTPMSPLALSGDQVSIDGRRATDKIIIAYLETVNTNNVIQVPDTSDPLHAHDQILPTTYSYQLCGVSRRYSATDADAAINYFLNGNEPIVFPNS